MPINRRIREGRPERMLAGGFLLLILIGGLLFSLPAASADGRSIGLFNGIFTAASAVCVTGLAVVDTGTAFSTLGHVILLVLVQLGSLGFMVFATLIMTAMGRKITLRGRMLIRESMNASTLSGLTGLAGWVAALTAAIEGLGAAILALRFVPMYGWGKGLFYSVFHAVSAFCNAGYDLMGDYSSLISFRNDPLFLLTIALLVILGGLGFSVMMEVITLRGKVGGLSLHAKIVLSVSAGLLALGTAVFALAEWNNPGTLAADGAHPGTKLMSAFFQSVTMRTAGFSTVNLTEMTNASKLMSCILMFIGAAPASTGGGVKVTTVSVLMLIVWNVIRGQENVNVFGKRLPSDLMRRALAILFISLAVLLAGAMFLALLEPDVPMMDVLIEITGAVTTAGVSTAGTASLGTAGRVLLIPLMFFGRVGPLTMALALAKKMEKGQNKLKYPEEKIMIG